jgi:uncharacterized protein YjbJ (UPF0337 family)
MNESWTGAWYSVFRGLLGAFLIVHFALLLPYGAEVFAAGGVLSSASLSPYIGALPNPLAWFDSPAQVTALLVAGVLAGIAVAIGWFDRVAAIAAALILGWLFQRNPLIANPSLPLLGWLLVMHAFVPPRPPGSVAAMRAGGADPAWRLPQHLYVAAWVVLAVAYSHSGYTKLLSPSWVEGETIRLVLENPLARDHFVRELLLALPPIYLKLLTWGVLWVEVLFAPLVLLRRLRPLMWTLMLLAQLGFLCFLNFADLTFPMLLAHLLTFDPRWLASRQRRECTHTYVHKIVPSCTRNAALNFAERSAVREVRGAVTRSAHFPVIPETRMNKDIAGGNFKQIKGKIKQQWGKLTDDEIDQMEGNADILAGKLQERYGLARDDAEKQAREFRSTNDWQ